VNRRAIKIGVAGTHSTGKSSFLELLSPVLRQYGLSAITIGGLAERAKALGFPILAEHTFDSALWIMAEGLRREAEASLHSDVVLVDRPVPDALGYLLAALEISGRKEDPRRIEELRAIARAHAGDYDILIVTSLDPSIPLKEGRDQSSGLRDAAARHLEALITEFAPGAWRLTSSNANELVAKIHVFISSRAPRESDS
jgi:AAA domain